MTCCRNCSIIRELTANSDDSFARLHAAGWTVGDVAVHGESGLVWLVTGTNG
jgi:hypothetical protein